jgi:hemoglobin-like flavoprotein
MQHVVPACVDIVGAARTLTERDALEPVIDRIGQTHRGERLH